MTVIILAGGKSSRMGQDKGLMEVKGKSMIQYVLEVVEPFADAIIISANNPEYKRFGYPVVEDEIKNAGPLAGLLSGLNYSQTDLNLVVTCDSPLISEKLLKMLLVEMPPYSFCYPSLNGNVYPLTACYHKSAADTIQARLNKGLYRVKDLIHVLKSKELVLDNSFETQLINVNTPEDVEKVK